VSGFPTSSPSATSIQHHLDDLTSARMSTSASTSVGLVTALRRIDVARANRSSAKRAA